MNESTYTFLRRARYGLQTLVEPIDWLARRLNSKGTWPPLRLRQSVGSLNTFEGSAGEYMTYLKLLCDLDPGHDLLDIGCGCGLICLPVNGTPSLPSYLYPGNYYGIDINTEAINWCQKHLKRDNTFFARLNKGQRVPTQGFIPCASGSFDVVLAKSLFTHLLYDETVYYLSEIYRLLKPGGRCLSTWFLINSEPVTKNPALRFRSRSSGPTYVLRPTRPEVAVAYIEDELVKTFDKCGLEVDCTMYGTWSGKQDGVSFQDIIVLRKGKE